ncbi:Nucleoside diphosphate kinase [Waddlia chondrophila 2032/99]|uniref:Nucleoside diphosphate kinase n=2 Tax=Waddlia chondrophila TaxID=71667 RepID=D6YS49_WADCW|nr:nucleoside-diphosphate kinase [Waddlia chondrophila]ADI38894.1 Nucleoside diphosphate kinase [Waddlia chondrophila WSU 86-1044]CCB90703.1 Nucleoside diphosphate kinase [Waddlia chondrophila 2032/99]
MLKKLIFTAAILFAPLFAQVEQTLSIIKPDAVQGHHIGEIIQIFEGNGLQVAAIKMVRMSKNDAMEFYEVHKDRPFYEQLTNFMHAGPVVAMVLEGENAVAKNRQLMGETNPENAKPGTIRYRFAKSVQSNAVHGSDSLENAKKEIAFFFNRQEIHTR